MTGLRAQNRADRTQRMLQSAARLFREAGYDAVRMEDIAADARVSAGTLYNYFATKGDLLLAIVSMEVEEVLATGAGLVLAPGDTAEAALNALVGGYYDHSLVYLSKPMWRRAIALSIEAPGTPLSQRYTDLDRRLEVQVGDLIRSLQTRGLVARALDAGALGDILFNNLNMMFIEFVKDDAMPLAALQSAMRRHHRMIMNCAGASGPP